MIGISFYELLVILVIAVVLFKPSELVNILFSLGLVIKKIKNFINNFQEDIDKVVSLGDLSDYSVKDKHTITKQDSSSKDIVP